MLRRNLKILLPKRSASFQFSKILQLGRNFFRYYSLRLLKFILLLPLFISVAGYQPVLAIPPFKRSVAEASFSEEQALTVQKLSKPFILPHHGYISTHFSAWHPGIDIAAPLGTPIHPVNDGKVLAVIYDKIWLGHHVIIAHDGGYESTYGHMGQILVKVGQRVSEDTILGYIGLTGNTSGPHTHLEIKKDGEYIDPTTILPPLPDMPVVTASSSASANPH